jgi:hypothetical protein
MNCISINHDNLPIFSIAFKSGRNCSTKYSCGCIFHSVVGLVFLQYRNETKRALLPNEITSIDTVKALFVRSFPKQLTMEYLDSPNVKIYIHDSSKDMFYELEDLRYVNHNLLKDQVYLATAVYLPRDKQSTRISTMTCEHHFMSQKGKRINL